MTTDSLEQAIRDLYSNSGPLDRHEVIGLLLEIFARIEALEDTIRALKDKT